MSYGPSEGPLPVKNRHRWTAIDNTGRQPWQVERGTHCPDCGIRRIMGGWYGRSGEWHTGPIPRCGESTWRRP